MSEHQATALRTIMVGALALAIAALPFSVKVCHAAIIAMLLSWLCEGSWRQKRAIISQSVLLQLIILFFLLQVAGLALSDNLVRGWFSVEKKIFFLLIPLALATSGIRLGRRDLIIVFGAFVSACFIATIVCLYSAWQRSFSPEIATLASGSYPQVADEASIQWILFSYTNLSNHINLHPTYFALYLAASILLLMSSLSTLPTKGLRIASICVIFYFTIFVVLLASRIIIVGISVVYLFLIAQSIIRKRMSSALLAVGASAFLVVLVFVNPVTHYRGIEEIGAISFEVEPGTNYATAAQIRMSLWWLGIQSLKNSNPLVGSGTGDVQKVMAATSANFDITNVIHSFDPHNQFLYAWLANGLPALLVLIACFALPAWWSWTKRDPLVLGFIFLFCLVCVTESALEIQKGIVFYALLSGLLFFHKHSFQDITVNFKTLTRVDQQRS